jgi:hypothetical protein
MKTAPLWIGIDVAKQQLDVAIGSTGANAPALTCGARSALSGSAAR